MTQVHIHIHRGRTADSWDESKHPRDGGKFATKPGAGKQLDRGGHHARLKEVDDNFAAHYAESKKHGLMTTPHGKAHYEAAIAWGKVRGSLNMNKPLDQQEARHNDHLAAARAASREAHASKTGKKD